MGKVSPIEKTVKFACTVETLQDAWQFVMEHLESVGDRPQILISPITVSQAWNEPK